MLLAPRTIVEITRINRATTHRATKTVIHRGCVEQSPNVSEYTLSITFLALAHVASREPGAVVSAEVRPILNTLSAVYRHSAHTAVLDGLELLHVDKIDRLERVSVASKIGSWGPVHTASPGKALLVGWEPARTAIRG